MSNLLHLSVKLRNGALEGAAAAAEVGAGAVRMRLYSAGSGIPANENVGITDQVLLAEHVSNLGANGFQDAAAIGSLSANAFDDIEAVGAGAPAFFRLIDANNEVAMQGTANTANAHVIVSTNNYIVGGMSSVTSFVLGIPSTAPAAV